MKNDQEWPCNTVALLVKKVNNTVIGQDYVDWAVQEMTDGFDSPNLPILASFDMGDDFSRFEAEDRFEKVAQVLGLLFPDKETILRNTWLSFLGKSKKVKLILRLGSSAYIKKL